MAIYKSDIVNIDLDSGSIFRSFLNNTIGTADKDANRFGVRVFRSGAEVDLSGCSCYGYFRDPQGNNIALTSVGTVSGNEAYITLPQACYNYEGQFCLAIKLIGGGVTGTVRIIDGVVDNTNTGSAVAPTSAVPTYTEILSQYDAMVAATAAANTAIAPTFAQGTAYAAGALVINDGALYALPNGHTAGTTWANTTKVATNLGDQVTSLKSALGAISTGNDTEFPLNTTWSQGGVNHEGEYSSWSRIRTDYIDLEGIGQLTQIPASGYASSGVFYDSSKQVTRYTLWSTQNVTVSLADNEKYVRFCLRKDPEANLSPSAGVNLTATAVYKLPSDVVANSNAIKKMQSFAVNDLIWELGGVSSGANFSSNTRIRTQFLDVSNYGRLTAIAQTGYKYVVNVFDKSKNYLFMIPAGGFVTDENIIEADENIGFIRVMLATANDDTLSNTSISSNFSLEADWKATGEIKNIANNDDNLLDGVTWVRGVLDNDGAYVSSTSRAVTDEYITLSGCKSLRFHPLVSTVWYAVFFFGDDGVISKTGTVIGDTEISVPSNSTKIKVFISNNPDAWLNDATIGNTLKIYKGTAYDQSNNGNILADDYFCSTCVNKKEIPNLSSGTTVLAFGDSITAEPTSAGWVYHFSAMTGCTVVNKAVGGSTFGHTETDSGHWISTQIGNTSDATFDSADLVIVAAGTNDYGHGEPLDGIKYYVQAAITAIKAKTSAPIVFITPIRRGLYVYDDPMQKLPMISGIISNVALANQCNVIRGFDIPIPTYNINGLIDNMTRDGLHPIETGANAYARFVIGALN